MKKANSTKTDESISLNLEGFLRSVCFVNGWDIFPNALAHEPFWGW